LARYIKSRYPHIFIAVGGVHASLNPEQVIAEAFDAVCIGEGEYPVVETGGAAGKRAYSFRDFKFLVQTGWRIEKNPLRPFLEKFGRIAFPRQKDVGTLDRKIYQGLPMLQYCWPRLSF